VRFRVVSLLPVVIALMSPGRASAQPFGRPEPAGALLGRFVYYEGISVPSALPGRSRVDILYRINTSFFVAARKQTSNLSGGLVRTGDIQIEIFDSTGEVAARKIDQFEKADAGPQAVPGSNWYQGGVSFDLVPGIYRISISVEDRESERRFSETERTVAALDFPSDTTVLGTPFFAFPPSGRALKPHNSGGGILFGTDGTLAAVIVNGRAGGPGLVEFDVREFSPEPTDSPEVVVPRKTVEASLFPSSSLALIASDPPLYSIDSAEARNAVAVIPFPVETLRPGRYLLNIAASGRPDRKAVFEVVWPEMPRSLKSPDYALESLRFITTRDELDFLEGGDAGERREHLERFWASRDRTPETAYNEVMTEYYTRVDFAGGAFGTLREPDGTRTDRGRIYILYGNPTKTERKLDPAGFIEIWSYKEAGKQFVFIDESRKGDYVLTSTKPL